MKKVITYGTYDLIHYGHIRLLQRAKDLGDYLIVGITSDDFDKRRGKINVQQSLAERINNVNKTGLADEIIIEEYEGQKIDDIIKMGVDIFAIGSDWEGKFDYLKEYCEVTYLPRTEGISSSEIRSDKNRIKLGLVGKNKLINKIANESGYVNGVEIECVLPDKDSKESAFVENMLVNNYDELLQKVDAVYLGSHPSKHYEQIKKALNNKKHVLCESPLTLLKKDAEELYELANKNNCVLLEGIKTMYSTAYLRMLLLLKGGVIGDIVDIDATCTSLSSEFMTDDNWNSICAWGPTAMLPVFQILGTDFKEKNIYSLFDTEINKYDLFTKITFRYDSAVAQIKVGKGVKSEGELIISGTKGYVYVPSPWWKMDYFEVRFENQSENNRYYYRLDGEGIRYELIEFLKLINKTSKKFDVNKNISLKISEIIDDFYKEKDLIVLKQIN